MAKKEKAPKTRQKAGKDGKLKIKVKFNGLFRTIFLTAILCMVIPMAVSSLFTIRSVSSNLEETSSANLQQLATEKGNQISEIISNQLELTQALVESPYVHEIVEKKYAAKDYSVDKDLCDYLGYIAGTRDNIHENLFVCVGSTFVADCHDGATAHDAAEENSYQTAVSEGMYIGKEFSPSSGQAVLIINVAITDSKGNVIGTVGNAISVPTMTEAIMNSFGEDSDYGVYLVDEEGVVIASPNPDDVLVVDFNNENETTQAVMSQVAQSETGTVSFEMDGVANMGAYSVSNGLTTLVYMPVSAYMAPVKSMVMSIVIIAVICIVVAAIVITLISTSIIRPLIHMVMLIEKYGNADFSEPVPPAILNNKNEIGVLGKALDNMQRIIREIFENIIAETDSVSNNVTTTQDEMLALSDTIGTVNDLVSDRAAESEETAASTEIISENALNVKDAVGEITDQANKGMEMSDDINDRASELKSGAERAQSEVVALTSELRDKLNNAVEQSKAVNQINALSDAILDIASETSLLSLNASIEAARAGEAGRGFAVVAEQIGKLADNSQETVGQIQDITKQVVVAVNNLADNSMETINTSAESLMDSIGAMTQSVGEISTANTEGAEGITNISHNTSDMQDMSVRVSDIMDSVQDSTVKLKETVNKLTV